MGGWSWAWASATGSPSSRATGSTAGAAEGGGAGNPLALLDRAQLLLRRQVLPARGRRDRRQAAPEAAPADRAGRPRPEGGAAGGTLRPFAHADRRPQRRVARLRSGARR